MGLHLTISKFHFCPVHAPFFPAFIQSPFAELTQSRQTREEHLHPPASESDSVLNAALHQAILLPVEVKERGN